MDMWWSVLVSLYISLILILKVDGAGKLFIGFLSFTNNQDLKFDGTCCDPQNNSKTGCTDPCDLIFNVTVSGFDNQPPESQRPFDKPISRNNTTFSSQNVTNPLTFDFQHWPGKINITVDVYDVDQSKTGETIYECVDHFLFIFEPNGPSAEYCLLIKNGSRSKLPTSLKILLRYNCNQFYYGRNCLRDCSKYPDQEKCPDYGTSNSVTGWDILISTPKPHGICRTIYGQQPGQTVTHNEFQNKTKTTDSPTDNTNSTVPLQINTSDTITPHSPSIVSSLNRGSHTSESTNEFSMQSEPLTNFQTISTDQEKTSQNIHTTLKHEKTDYIDSQLTNIGLPTKMITQTPHKQEIRTIIDRTQTNNSSRVNENPSSQSSTEYPINVLYSSSMTTDRTQPTAIPDNNDGGAMQYWPGIVGGVLGALALIAIVAFVVYYKKQKDAQIRQDIYNVNPKKWALEPPEENGTSGKSEIALETEPV